MALASVAAGWAARQALTPQIGPTQLPFIFFFPQIALVAWFGGLGPALLASALSAAVADWFYFEPLHSFALQSRDLWAFGAFGLAALAIVLAIESTHRVKAQLIRSRDLL